MKIKTVLVICSICWAYSLSAQDEEAQSRESMAVDATATQWSFQFAYQFMPDYHSDVLSNGNTRPEGMDNYAQLRIVAPIPMKGLTILPRLTIRHYEAPSGKSGFGNTELFALMIPGFSNWGTGRAGIGPLVTMPGNPDVSKDEWGYGFAAAVVQNKGNWFFGLLFTQTFRSIDPNTLPAGKSDANPLGIAPFVNYRFGSTGLYLQTADIVALYDWDTGEVYVPMGARFGKVWVWEKASLNVYGEYRTSMIYKNWSGSAVKNSYRLNVSYTIPIGG
jgi:heme/copper-type cytochrome/quinol oxidase subunit 2